MVIHLVVHHGTSHARRCNFTRKNNNKKYRGTFVYIKTRYNAVRISFNIILYYYFSIPVKTGNSIIIWAVSDFTVGVARCVCRE